MTAPVQITTLEAVKVVFQFEKIRLAVLLMVNEFKMAVELVSMTLTLALVIKTSSPAAGIVPSLQLPFTDQLPVPEAVQ